MHGVGTCASNVEPDGLPCPRARTRHRTCVSCDCRRPHAVLREATVSGTPVRENICSTTALTQLPTKQSGYPVSCDDLSVVVRRAVRVPTLAQTGSCLAHHRNSRQIETGPKQTRISQNPVDSSDQYFKSNQSCFGWTPSQKLKLCVTRRRVRFRITLHSAESALSDNTQQYSPAASSK